MAERSHRSQGLPLSFSYPREPKAKKCVRAHDTLELPCSSGDTCGGPGKANCSLVSGATCRSLFLGSLHSSGIVAVCHTSVRRAAGLGLSFTTYMDLRHNQTLYSGDVFANPTFIRRTKNSTGQLKLLNSMDPPLKRRR